MIATEIVVEVRSPCERWWSRSYCCAAARFRAAAKGLEGFREMHFELKRLALEAIPMKHFVEGNFSPLGGNHMFFVLISPMLILEPSARTSSLLKKICLLSGTGSLMGRSNKDCNRRLANFCMSLNPGSGTNSWEKEHFCCVTHSTLVQVALTGLNSIRIS